MVWSNTCFPFVLFMVFYETGQRTMPILTPQVLVLKDEKRLFGPQLVEMQLVHVLLRSSLRLLWRGVFPPLNPAYLLVDSSLPRLPRPKLGQSREQSCADSSKLSKSSTVNISCFVEPSFEKWADIERTVPSGPALVWVQGIILRTSYLGKKTSTKIQEFLALTAFLLLLIQCGYVEN